MHEISVSIIILPNKDDPLTRSRVKKAAKEEQFDPQTVAAVEAKLRALGVDSALSSGADAT